MEPEADHALTSKWTNLLGLITHAVLRSHDYMYRTGCICEAKLQAIFETPRAGLPPQMTSVFATL